MTSRNLFGLLLAFIFLCGACAPAAPVPAGPANPNLILATTTSTQDSGLLDVLIPLFEAESGYSVQAVAVGSGQAMKMGEEGNADVLLVHAPASEVASWKTVSARTVPWSCTMTSSSSVLRPTRRRLRGWPSWRQ